MVVALTVSRGEEDDVAAMPLPYIMVKEAGGGDRRGGRRAGHTLGITAAVPAATAIAPAGACRLLSVSIPLPLGVFIFYFYPYCPPGFSCRCFYYQHWGLRLMS